MNNKQQEQQQRQNTSQWDPRRVSYVVRQTKLSMLIHNIETKCWANSNRVKYLCVCVSNVDFPVNLNQINAKCAFTLTKSSSLNVAFLLKHYKLPENKGDIYSKLLCSLLTCAERCSHFENCFTFYQSVQWRWAIQFLDIFSVTTIKFDTVYRFIWPICCR